MRSPVLYFTVKGGSMKPYLVEGEKVWINRLAYIFHAPKIGDIVVVRHPAKKVLIIKRIKDINKDRYFVTGDNLNESTDSRHFGWIQKKQILGKVLKK